MMRLRSLAQTQLKTSAMMAVVAVLMFSLTINASAADVSNILTLDLGTAVDSNLTRAIDAYEQLNDTSAAVAVTFGKRIQLNEADRLSMTLDLKETVYKDYTKLNNMNFGLMIAFMHKIGLGQEAPWVRMYGGATRLDFREKLRDGAQYDIGIQTGKRFGGGLDLSAGYSLQSRKASNNRVYSGNGSAASLTASLPVFGVARLALSGSFRWGDVTVHNEDYWPPESAWMWVYTFDERMAAYRINAHTRILSGTLTWPFNEKATLYLGTERQETRWENERYPNNIWRLGVNYRVH